jgi:hypothetical protein
MEMFLMVACVSLFGLAVTALAFGAATQPSAPAPPEAVAERKSLDVPSKFFAAAPPQHATAAGQQIPIEVLLLQIDRHVRLEQAAAESFLELPTAESLHCRTTSPLVH